MSSKQDQISRLTALTALLPDSPIDISSVLDSFDMIAETPTPNIEHVTRSGKNSLSLRPDDVSEDGALPDKLLNCSPQRVAAHQIVLSGIMQGE